MAKTFEVEIGGKVRRLSFHQRDAIELKKRFGEMPHTLLFKRVLGLDFANAPAGGSARVDAGLMDPEVQYAVLHRALVRGGSKVTEDQVIEWVNEAVQAPESKVSVADFVIPATKCAFYSGAITGSQLDVGGDESEGKVSASAEPAP